MNRPRRDTTAGRAYLDLQATPGATADRRATSTFSPKPFPNDVDAIVALVRDVLAVEADDGVVFEPDRLTRFVPV